MVYVLPHLLRASAARAPDATAVRDRGTACSYADLEARTNQVARSLIAAGVRRGDRVGIYLHKSLGSVIAVIAAMKAGATYVPLDPGAPVQRLAYIAADCGVRALLTGPEMADGLAGLLASTPTIATAVMLADGDVPAPAPPAAARIVGWTEVLSESESEPPEPPVIETDLAYILYTSGSTGTPKGVMITHRNALTFVDWCHATFALAPDDRITSHAPLHFDLSIFDIFATLAAGATIVIVPEKLSVFPVQLTGLLQDERITVTYLVPSVLSMMVKFGEIGRHDLSALRAILFAGEVFPIKHLRDIAAAIPHVGYYNLYGPTETNVCTYYKVLEADLAPARDEPVPIGAACANIEVFAVDDDGARVTAPGGRGELWVRGPCVAKGYWGDRAKTAAGFVANTHESRFDEIAYRTGDIVVLDGDGVNWRYVGRRDHMVKSRGYRIELGEIETAILSHQAVSNAAVVAVPDEMIGNRLKAFVVVATKRKASAKELAHHCGERLPRYMVPESFEFLDALPTTSTGKTDRVVLQRRAAEVK